MERLSLKSYVVMNLAFWAFCAVQYVILRIWLKHITGIPLLIILLGAGFSIVCVFDYLAGLASSSTNATAEKCTGADTEDANPKE